MSTSGQPPSRRTDSRAAPIRARLATELPDRLDIGLGNCVVLQGHCSARRREVGGAALTLGDRAARMLGFDMPPPGQRGGGGWWTALAEIPTPPGEESAAILLAVGGEELELARLRLRPGPIGKLPSPGGSHVAICIATHEPPPELLRAQIASIVAQTHEDWSCVIADDASSPAALREISRLVEGDERFTVHAGDRRLGFYRNFERALKEVPPGAAFVALADQDDEWHPEKLAALLEGIGEAGLVHSDARVVDGEGRQLAPGLWPGRRPGESLPEVLFANPVTGASCLFRRELLEFALPFPALAGAAFHDRWLALVASAQGSIARVDRPLYDYVQHEGSALGHAGVAGAAHDRTRLAAARRRLGGLARGELRPDWRAAHDDYLLRSLGEAVTLRLRLGDRLDGRERAALAEVEGLAGSTESRMRLGVRAASRALQGRPGIEPALIRGVAWPALARARTSAQAVRDRATALRGGSGSSRGGDGGSMRIGITVSDADESAGFGDLFVARALAAQLGELGHETRLLDLAGDGWRGELGSLDSVLSLLDGFRCDAVPDGVRLLAWVRNWTERWVERSWFDRYELALASSAASAGLIGELSDVPTETMPLATDPARFRPVPSDPELACDVLFAGNNWGGERAVSEILPALSERFRVRVFGRGWESVEGMAELSAGPLDHDRLPSAYCSAALVVDDSASHAAPYGAVNSRVFDALACGAAVASNDAEGVRALFGEDFPVFTDAESLATLVAQAIESPGAVGRRTEKLRAQVLAHHTYAQRARRLVSLLAANPSPR